MRLNNPPLSYYVNLLDTNQPFALSRFGDGEWAWMLDIPHVNEEGHGYFPEMASDLRISLERNHPYPFHYSMPELKLCHNQERIVEYCKGLPVDWYDCSTFRRANVAGELYPLVEAMRKKKMVYVGPEHLDAFIFLNLHYISYVNTPKRNAYEKKGSILRAIRYAVEWEKPDAIGFSAGPLANILIDELWDGSVTLIDFGSIWDPYVGVKSRRYMLNDLSEQMKRNLGEL